MPQIAIRMAVPPARGSAPDAERDGGYFFDSMFSS